MNPSWGEIFRTSPDRPWGPPSFLYNGYQVFPGVKERPGLNADPLTPLLLSWSRKGRAIPLLSPMGRTVCREPQCMYKGALYLYLYLFRLHDGTGCEAASHPLKWVPDLFPGDKTVGA